MQMLKRACAGGGWRISGSVGECQPPACLPACPFVCLPPMTTAQLHNISPLYRGRTKK